MGQLEKLSEAEAIVLTAIVALAQQLTKPLTSYVEALGEIRRTWFKVPGTWDMPSRDKACIDGHQVRASEPWA